MKDLIGTITRTPAGSSIELRRTYSADQEDLWSAITEPARISRWLGTTTHDGHVGGDWLTVFDADDPSGRSGGRIEQCDAPSHLRVTWQSPGEDAGLVDVTITALDDERCELHLRHDGLVRGNDTGYAAGWQVHLSHLEAALAGQDDPDFWDQWQELRDQYAATVE